MVTVAELASEVGGGVRGDSSITISEAATMANARPGEITLAVSADHAKELAQSQASAAVVPRGFPDVNVPALIEVDDVEAAFGQIVARFRPPREFSISATRFKHWPASCSVAENSDIHPSVVMGHDVVIGKNCRIHAGVVIGDGTRIGDNVTIFPNVVLYENTLIGNRVIIHAGSVIGAYGFGYRTRGGRHELSPQLGHVEIHDDVEIGACTTIDRGTYDATVVGEGTKIDDHVMIGHNCHIGKHNFICSLAGIAGSCRTGDYVVLAGQSGLSDHISLGNGARVAAKSGVMQNVPDGETYAGLPAMPERDFWRMWVTVTHLPEMRKQMKELQKEVAALRNQLQGQRDAA